MVLAARVVLGVFYLVSGLNWFFGFLPLPSIHSPPDFPIKHAVVAEMIRTGWMFQSAKIVEIAFGLSLIFNRAVPAMLLVALPVGFMTFMLDALVLDDIWRWLHGAETSTELGAALFDMVVGGLCVLLVHLWLVWCYFDYYRPMIVWRSSPRGANGGRFVAGVFVTFGLFAIALQAWNLYGFVDMIKR
jgi:hypothetical protein